MRAVFWKSFSPYRCNARCNMCDCWRDPSRPEDEISLEVIRKLPEMAFTNITGGEPFIRKDLAEIVEELYKKSDRIVISTNGYFTDRILELCKRFPKLGIRISIEGMQATNDAIRRIPDGWQRGYTTLKTLVEMGHPDVGFGMTVQDMITNSCSCRNGAGLNTIKHRSSFVTFLFLKQGKPAAVFVAGKPFSTVPGRYNLCRKIKAAGYR